MDDKIYKTAKAILNPNQNIFERIMGLSKFAAKKPAISKPKTKGNTITVPKEFYEKLPSKKGYTVKTK